MHGVLSKLRLTLIPETPVGRYIYYALGEILLIVIGILLALQLNNWNQDRKLKANELVILESLLADLKSAQIQSKRGISNETSALFLLESSLKPQLQREQLFAKHNTDKILYQLFWNFEVDVPVINTYADLKSTGKKDLIKNADIRNRFTNIEMAINNLTNLINDRSTVQQLKIDSVVVNQLNFVRLLKTDSPSLQIALGENNDFNAVVNDPTNRNLIAMKFELTQSVNNFRIQLAKDIAVLIDIIEDEIDDH